MVPTIANGWKLQVETYGDVLVGARRHYTAAPTRYLGNLYVLRYFLLSEPTLISN